MEGFVWGYRLLQSYQTVFKIAFAFGNALRIPKLLWNLDTLVFFYLKKERLPRLQ